VSAIRGQVIFAAAIVVTGVLSGIAGGATTALVHLVEHITYGYSQGPLLIGMLATPISRRIAGPAIGCALAGAGWWRLRSRTTVPRLSESIRRDLPFDHKAMASDERAPRLFAAAFTERVIRRSSLSVLQRRILLGSAAGAGLAAVYNVPAAGALFALGIVLNSWAPLAVLVAVATSAIATVTTWPLSHGAPTFVWPDTHYSWRVLLFAIAAMPIGLIVGTGFSRLVELAKRNALKTSWLLIPAVGLAGLATGICSIWMPQLPGNGKSIILQTLSGGDTLIPIAVVVLLKPVLTALFLRAGAEGGLLTPALSTGVATGAFVGLAVNQLGLHASIPTFGLIGGAAVLGITQEAPVFAAVFTAELTHPPWGVWLMLLLAALGAHGIRAMPRRRVRKVPAER
jgi:H+/Cl- antiporter ClcA